MGKTTHGCAALAAVLLAAGAQAQDAGKPIRFMVPFPPGGSGDTLARTVAQPLSRTLRQNVVVENRTGGNTVIATELLHRAPADGHMMNVVATSFTVNPFAYAKLPYDSLRDFSGVTLLAVNPLAICVHPSLPVKTVKELTALAKSKPGELTCASSGTGSTQHLALEMYMTLTGVKIIHVPYKGSGQAIVDLVAGQVGMNFDTMPPVIDHIRGGRLRALAVTTPKRAAQLPDVPTLEETGLKGFEMTNWYGVVAPAAVPKDIIAKVNADLNKALADPTVRKRLMDVGTEISGGTPEAFDAFIRSEIAKYTKLVKAAGVTID